MPHNDRVEENLQKILDKLTEHSIILARHTILHEQNTKDLEHHIKRTDLLEADLKKAREDLEEELEEATAPFQAIKTLAKYAGYLTAISSAVGVIILIIKHFKG